MLFLNYEMDKFYLLILILQNSYENKNKEISLEIISNAFLHRTTSTFKEWLVDFLFPAECNNHNMLFTPEHCTVLNYENKIK